jgi:uncharacterized protein (TIGR02001 family)
MMKKTLMAAALLAGSQAAVGEISGNVTIATDYRFRGISQTDRDPTIQGGFDYAHESGLYAGIWASNIAFAGSIEMDYYGGYAGNINDNIGFDVGVIYYDYPSDNQPSGANDLEFWEVYGGLSGDVGPVSLSGKLSYSPDYYGETGDGLYTDLGASYGLPRDFTLSAHFGYQYIEDGAFKDEAFFSSNEDSYTDWSIGVSKSWMGVDFDLSYIDTNLGSSDLWDTKNGDDTVVFSVSKSL